MRKTVIAVVVGGLVATTAPVGPATAAKRVPDKMFGQHIAGISAGQPRGLAGNIGSVRLWDSGVTWREVEVANNRYNWRRLDSAVANARRLGAKEVLYVLGSTPRWAASNPNSRLGLYGPGSNSHPRSDKLFLDYLKAVAKRYKGKITAYQMWNEANLPDFYLGTTTQMAKLTKKARKVLKRADRKAKLVAASTTVRDKGPVRKWGRDYGRAMKRVKWPVHAVSAHFYPPANDGPETRRRYVKIMKKYYKRWGAKRKPLWDTEMNYGDTRPYMRVKRTYTGDTARTYVARTYIDSQRYKVARVFWYGWDHYMLGTDMTARNGSGAITAGGQAFITIRKWMSRNKWYGCKTKRKVTTCTMKDGKKKVRIRYSTSGSRSYKIPKKVSRVDYLNGRSTPVRRGQRITLTTQPVLMR